MGAAASFLPEEEASRLTAVSLELCTDSGQFPRVDVILNYYEGMWFTIVIFEIFVNFVNKKKLLFISFLFIVYLSPPLCLHLLFLLATAVLI